VNPIFDSPSRLIRMFMSVCAALFFGCLGVNELVHGIPALTQANQFVSRSAATESIRSGRHKDWFHYIVEYEYVVSTKNYSKSEEVSEAFFQQHPEGHFTVYYDRTQPYTAYVDLERLYKPARDKVLFGGGAIIFCVVMCSFWYWMAFGKRWSR
jgi:hypothetical protein